MQSAQAAEAVERGDVSPCHEQFEENVDGEGGVMLMQDCMGVDLQKSNMASIDKPDLKTDLVIYASLTNVLNNLLTKIESDSIRGSPLRPDFAAIDLPIYQVTQRFRL